MWYRSFSTEQCLLIRGDLENPHLKYRKQLWARWRRHSKLAIVLLASFVLVLMLCHGIHHIESTVGVAAYEPVQDETLTTVNPIPSLIAEAESAWRAKIDRQSTTLEQAVDEYKRRYQRSPPKGFDKWWAYARHHDVQLLDEYDSIDTSIRPFLALPPRLYGRRLARALSMKDVSILRVQDGEIDIDHRLDKVESKTAVNRLRNQIDAIKPIARWLPNFTSVWSPHDTARILIHHSEKRELLSSNPGEYDDVSEEEGEGFRAACHFHTKPLPRFIRDHQASLDICAYPDLFPLHGAFAVNKEPSVTSIVPLFSISKTALHSDILGIPYSHDIKEPYVPWNERTSKALWRGGATGAHYDQTVDWKQFQRFRLVSMGDKNWQVLQPSGRSVTMSGTQAVGRWLDAALTGEPIQCDERDGTCRQMAKRYHFEPRIAHRELASSKYLVDVDGNAWSARFKGLLRTGAVVLHSSVMAEWYQDRIQPWKHYVPLSIKYDELFDVMAFFEGTPDEDGHDDQAERIGLAGKVWVEQYWREEDMTAYTFRLMLEYARLGSSSHDRDYHYDASHEVDST